MQDPAKPEAARLGWQLLETSFPLQTKWLKVRRDLLRLPNGHGIEYTYISGSGAVVVVPVTSSGEMLLIRQYRYTVDAWCLEVPAGGMHDKGGATPEEVARQELCEETGATCERLEYLSFFYPSNGSSSSKMHLFLALGVQISHEPERDETEVIEVCPLPVREVLDMARGGHIHDGVSALAILLCEARLREEGLLG
ncbi:MAG: NUDIX hydrolase [Chloroflexota bacterium]|nr:NUDIX hydrolase [Chloroflexota bacterium]